MEKSEISIKIDTSVALPVDLNPLEIEMSSNKQVFFINKKNFPWFLLKTSLFQLLIYFILIYYYLESLNQPNEQQFCYLTNICINFQNKNEEFWVFVILLIISFLLPSVIFNSGRGLSVFPLLLIIVFIHFYLPPWISYYLGQGSRLNFLFKSLCVVLCLDAFAIFLSSVFCIILKFGFYPAIGISLGVFFNLLFLLTFEFLLIKKESDFLLFFIKFFFCILHCFYINYDIRQILRERCFFYFKDDYFLCYIHLQTDLFARFWIYCFKK
jgi:hypothetical protein